MSDYMFVSSAESDEAIKSRPNILLDVPRIRESVILFRIFMAIVYIKTQLA